MIHNSLSHVLLILVDNLSQIKFINMEKKNFKWFSNLF